MRNQRRGLRNRRPAYEFEDKHFQRRFWSKSPQLAIEPSFAVNRKATLVNTDPQITGIGVDFGNSHRGLIDPNVDFVIVELGELGELSEHLSLLN